MAWIEFHAGLRDHWKIKRLSIELKCSYPQALGHISCLWCWCIDNAASGYLKKFSDEELCEAARISVKIPFKMTLKRVELLDSNDRIHDWGKHGLKYLESTRKRVREHRLRKRYSNVTVTPTNQPTNLTNQPTYIGECFEEFSKLYPKKVGMSMALITFRNTIKTEKDFEDIKTALKNYMTSDEVKKGFIKNCNNWIEDWRGWLSMKPKTRIIA